MAAADDQLRIGSGKHGTQLESVYCANFASPGSCNNQGSKYCKNCKLVAYCSRECQAQHWVIHKTLCKSQLMLPSWSPCWVRESRTPSFINSSEDYDGSSPSVQPLHVTEGLWGNVPAYGILGSTEGRVLPNHLHVCFAASGDLRNVIETVCQIPGDFKGKATFYVNDVNAKVMVRNFLMLEMLRVHGSQAIDAVIALWYSIALTSAQLKAMKLVAKQVLQRWASEQAFADMYEYSCSSEEKGLIAQFGRSSLQILRLLCENGMSLERAKETRTAVMNSRPDLVDRRMRCLRPAHRLAWFHFRQTGILLPFASQSCAETNLHHVKANRFLLRPILGWTVGDGHDPLDGWDMKQVISTGKQCGVPLNDLYGSLFFHLRAKIQSFLNKWNLCGIDFVLSNMEASDLAVDLCGRKVGMHRIDTSNLADGHHKGIERVLTDWGPVLMSKSVSSSRGEATIEPLLITYFMNWACFYNRIKAVNAVAGKREGERLLEPATTVEEFAEAVEKGMRWGLKMEGFRELAMQLTGLWFPFFRDYSKAFNEYLRMRGVPQIAERVGVQRKQKHSVVPHRLFVGVTASASATPASNADLEDFYMRNVLHFNRTMTERFVEWALKC